MHSSSFVLIRFYSRHSSSSSQSPQNCAHLWCQAVHWRCIWTSGGAEVTGGRMEVSGVSGKPPRQFVWIWRSYWSWWKEECPSWISTNWNERWARNNTAHRLRLVLHLRRWADHSVRSNQAVRHHWRSWRLQNSVKGGGEGQAAGERRITPQWIRSISINDGDGYENVTKKWIRAASNIIALIRLDQFVKWWQFSRCSRAVMKKKWTKKHDARAELVFC